MLISVCIIAYNEEQFLPGLFEDILAQDYPHKDLEVVLVDSASTDKTKRLMLEFAESVKSFYKIKVEDNIKRKQACGWNIAIAAAAGEVVFRIDAHAKIPVDFVSKNVRQIEAGEYVSGGQRPCITEERTKWREMLLLAENSMFGSGIAIFKRGKKQEYVKTVFHGAYRKEIFEHVGGFNENLGRTEDNEMHYRIRKAGYKICYSPDIISYQYTRNSWHGSIRQKFANGYWIGLTIGICPKCFSVYHFVPCIFVLAEILSVILLLLGHICPFIILTLLYCTINILMSCYIAVQNRKNGFVLLLPLVFLSLHISYGIGTLVGLIYMPYWVLKLH